MDKDIITRLDEMNKRYIRKPECKKTLEDAVVTIRQLRKQLAEAYGTPKRGGFSPTYRG